MWHKSDERKTGSQSFDYLMSQITHGHISAYYYLSFRKILVQISNSNGNVNELLCSEIMWQNQERLTHLLFTCQKI